VAEAATGGTVTEPPARYALRVGPRDLRTRPAFRRLNAAALGLALIAATCPPYQNVGINSTPSEAQIFVDGDLVGHTPAQISVGTLDDHKVYLKKEGYRPELVVLLLHRPTDQINFLTPPDVYVTLTPLSDSSLDSDVTVEIEEE
jgi:hypothetical protein